MSNHRNLGRGNTPDHFVRNGAMYIFHFWGEPVRTALTAGTILHRFENFLKLCGTTRPETGFILLRKLLQNKPDQGNHILGIPAFSVAKKFRTPQE